MNYSGLKEDKRLIEAVPTARQIAYESMEFFCFIHFTVNTFTGREWGDGTEPESIFNPTELDAKQWAKTAVEGGMKGLILPANITTDSACGHQNTPNTVSKTLHIKMERVIL